MPGVSTKTICAGPSIAMPSTRARVVCTFRETIETFAPTRAFSSVDLPELGAPISATKPAEASVGGGLVGVAITLARRMSLRILPRDHSDEELRRNLLRQPLRAAGRGR